jgi:hypothetical protein
MRGLLKTKEFREMIKKHALSLKDGNAEKMYDRLFRLSKKISGMGDDVFIEKGTTKNDVKEQILGAADTLAALTRGECGWGHNKKYFRKAKNREQEYIAHAFENYFVGNDVFKEFMPEIYNDMVKYIEMLISR